jgi:protein-S-isoprenylcysteine O-methyltransferase Ste14
MHSSTGFGYGMWAATIFSVGLVFFFVGSFMLPTRRREWRSMGLFAAWIVALFTEMYGIPLTIYTLTALLGRAYPVLNPFTHQNGHLLVALAGGSKVVWMIVMLVSNLLFWGGILVMERGWRLIHRAQGALVTEGIYSRVRHPQYLGLFMVIIGLLIQWPTIISLLMAPVLFWSYTRLARREEREVEAQFGEAYRTYKEQTPAFVPRWQSLPPGLSQVRRKSASSHLSRKLLD